MNNHHEELIQRELDHDLSSREQAELLATVADDPQTQALREEMLSLGLELDSLANRKPTPELKHNIMAAIAADPAQIATKPRRSPAPARALDRRHALAFAAGIAVRTHRSRPRPTRGQVHTP
jgi:hypothetical protein